MSMVCGLPVSLFLPFNKFLFSPDSTDIIIQCNRLLLEYQTVSERVHKSGTVLLLPGDERCGNLPHKFYFYAIVIA